MYFKVQKKFSQDTTIVLITYSYQYAEIYKGVIDGKLKKIGIIFANEKSVQSIPITRKKYKTTYTKGTVMYSKSLVNDIYTTYPSLPQTCHFELELNDSSHKKMLIFDLKESLYEK